jgi:hypothetical protein
MDRNYQVAVEAPRPDLILITPKLIKVLLAEAASAKPSNICSRNPQCGSA